MKDDVKVFDALKAREVLERVNKFLGILIRESLVKDAPFLKDGEIENESDLADDVWEVLQGVPRNCDVGTAEEQKRRWHANCGRGIPNCKHCKVYEQAGKSGLVDDKNRIRFDCRFIWAQMPYDEVNG